MPNPTLNWRFVAPVVPSPDNTTAGWLDAIYAALTAATYNDGSPRMPGTGSAWTGTLVQIGGVTQAVYAAPPTVTAVNQRVIFAGAQVTPSPSPTMTLNEAYTNGNIMVGLNLDSGAFNAWNAALPFTSGRFTGYARLRQISIATWVRMYLWESQESLAVQFVASTGVTTLAAAGAIIDPLQGGLAAETDGRVYGMGGTGYGNMLTAAWLTNPGFSPFNHSAVANYCRSVAFQPQTSTRIPIFASAIRGTLLNAVTLAGNVPLYNNQVVIQATDQVPASPNRFVGLLRGFGGTRDYRTGLTLQIGGVDVGYTLGSQDAPAAADEAVFLPK